MTESRSPNKPSPIGRGDFQIRRTIIRTKGRRPIDLALREEDEKEQNRKRAMHNPHNKQAKGVPAPSIFKQQKEIPTPQPPMPIQQVTEEMVKCSKLYRMMEEQIASAIARHAEEMESLMNTLDGQNRQSDSLMKDSHSLKIKVWDLRNEIIRLQSELGQQQQENAYLTGMAGAQAVQSHPSNELSEQSYVQQSERQMERLDTYQAQQEKEEGEIDQDPMPSDTDSTPERRMYSSHYNMRNQ